jgi:hypothetical protein
MEFSIIEHKNGNILFLVSSGSVCGVFCKAANLNLCAGIKFG